MVTIVTLGYMGATSPPECVQALTHNNAHWQDDDWPPFDCPAYLFLRTACMPASWQMAEISALLILSGLPT